MSFTVVYDANVLYPSTLRDLAEAAARNNQPAARRLKAMRRLAAGTPHAGEVDDLIAELRRTHHRRPRLQQEFDRARLP